MKPFFSIIVPCCDVAPYVRECLDSVMNQPFTDWECLIGVETSKDNTEAIVREYEAKDSRFRVFTGPRSGSCSASRNTGIDMATGEYIIFLDGDDTIIENSLQRLYDKIAAHPGADLYPCAMLVYDDLSKNTLEVRDNYPPENMKVLTGQEATILTYEYKLAPCPMLQLSVFRREFLVANSLKCIHGLRRQDSEFFPRALYLATRVIPIHELFYMYRIQSNSVSSSAHGVAFFHHDWAIIFNSLLSFHACVSKDNHFNKQISLCWMRHWLRLMFFFWFAPQNIRMIPRPKRLETLNLLFCKGFDDFNILLNVAPFYTRIAGIWLRIFVKYPLWRLLVECLFRVYFYLSAIKLK